MLMYFCLLLILWSIFPNQPVSDVPMFPIVISTQLKLKLGFLAQAFVSD